MGFGMHALAGLEIVPKALARGPVTRRLVGLSAWLLPNRLGT